MPTRRSFMKSIGAAGAVAALASYRDGGVERIMAASRSVRGTSPQDVAMNEDYWREIQQAFTVDPSALAVVREVRDKFVNTVSPPVSTFVVVRRLVRPEWLIEAEAVAVVPE